MWQCLLLLVACLSLPQQPLSTLVLIDTIKLLDTHSSFISLLSSYSSHIEYATAKDNINLIVDGKYKYDNIVIMASNLAGFSPSLKQFLDASASHSIMMFADYANNNYFRGLARELGVEISPQNSILAGAPYSVNQYVFQTANVITENTIVSQPANPIVFQGTGMRIDDANPFVFSILNGMSNTCLHQMRKEGDVKDILECGTQITLVAGVQSRYNNRAIISGSLQMCSNDLMIPEYSATGNMNFCREMVEWVFKESGNIKIENMNHYTPGTDKTPDVYRINEETLFKFDFMIWNKTTKVWNAFSDDVQVEFVMLYPYVRLTMDHEQGNATYHSLFKIPNKIGVFKYKVGYKRVGFLYLNQSLQVSVRPYGNNELDRFYPAAYPYYGSIFVCMIGFAIVVIAMLSSK